MAHARDEVLGLPRVIAVITGDRDGRARPGELVEQRIGQGRVYACDRDLLWLGHAVRGGMEGRSRRPIVAPDGHKSAVLPEPSELALRADEALGGCRRYRQLELRPRARPPRVLADRLGGIRREPARPLESAGRLARGGHYAQPDGRRLRYARLGSAAGADEESGGVDEIAVRPHLIEDALRYHDREIRLQGQRQLDEIERIGS